MSSLTCDVKEKKNGDNWWLDDEGGLQGSFGMLMIFYYQRVCFEGYFPQNE